MFSRSSIYDPNNYFCDKLLQQLQAVLQSKKKIFWYQRRRFWFGLLGARTWKISEIASIKHICLSHDLHLRTSLLFTFTNFLNTRDSPHIPLQFLIFAKYILARKCLKIFFDGVVNRLFITVVNIYWFSYLLRWFFLVPNSEIHL